MMNPQMAPPMPQAEAMPDPMQMQQAVMQRLQELEAEKQELMAILQQMEGQAAPQGMPPAMAPAGPEMAAGPPMGAPPMGGLLG